MPVATPACRHPFDVPFLALALVAKADILLTGDKDLLSPSGKLACAILRAESLLDQLRRRPSAQSTSLHLQIRRIGSASRPGARPVSDGVPRRSEVT